MKVMKRLLGVGLLVLALVAVASAQDLIQPIAPPEDPSVEISFPPPVYVMRGTMQIRGSANALGMANYFLQVRPLQLIDEDSDVTPIPDEDRPWFPLTLPANQPVAAGVLGEWNTLTVSDGLYQLRLIVNINGQTEPRTFTVSPLRVENNLPDFLQNLRPTLAPTPTQLPGAGTGGTSGGIVPTAVLTGPRVVALVDANVRTGDSTIYERIGALLRGEAADIVGISSRGTEWYYIQMPNGRRGFIAGSTVRIEGSLSGLPFIDPPPPPVTPTPLPTATPVTQANLLGNGLRLEPATPTCNVTFTIFLNVTNTGSAPTSGSANISVVDRHVASGTVAATTVGAVPVLNPGQNFVAVMPLTVSAFYNEQHTITITIDPENRVPETNEGDNVNTITYTLQQGGC